VKELQVARAGGDEAVGVSMGAPSQVAAVLDSLRRWCGDGDRVTKTGNPNLGVEVSGRFKATLSTPIT
jgi:hypothetical protein